MELNKAALDIPEPDTAQTYVSATVTDSDIYTGSFRRVPNTMLGYRLDLAAGPAAVWVKLNATACAAVRTRLYRAGSGGKPVSKARRLYLESGRAGAKAAKWASDAGELTEVETHPVLDVLAVPNAWQSGHEFTWQRYWLREACGNAFVLFDDEGNRPTLHNLNPRWSQIVPSRTNMIGSLRYGREDSIVETIEMDRICHYRLFPGEDPYYGATWITDVAEAILVLKANYTHQERFIRSGMLPPFALKINPAATPEQTEEIRRELRRHHAGLSRWSEPLLLKNAEVVLMPAEPNKYQTVEQLMAFRRDIRNAAGVPESMADVNDANLASATVGYDQQYLGTTIAPRVERMCADDTVLLLPKFGLEPGEWFFAMDEIVAADDAAMLARHQVAVGKPWMSPNEARQEWGMEAVDGFDAIGNDAAWAAEGTDAPAAPPSETEPEALDDAGTGKEPLASGVLNGAQVASATDIVVRVAAGELPRDSALAMLQAFFALSPEVAASVLGSAGTGAKTTPNVPEGGNVEPGAEVPEAPAPDAPPEPTPSAEEVVKSYGSCPCCVTHKAVSAVNLSPEAERAATKLETALREWYEKYGASASVSASGQVIMSAEADDALRALLRPALFDLMQAGVADAGNIGGAAAFVPKVPESYVLQVAGSITESAQNALTAAIRSGVEGGATVNELQRMVAEAAPELSGDASYRIARTEGAYATEAARHQLDVANGATHHEWELAANGCKVCEAFVAQYGKARPINEPYAVAGTTFDYVDETGAARMFTVWRDAMHPPLHPNCRCTDKTVEAKDEMV